MRNELFSEIHDKLATDAFIEAHENEIDRQANEFNKYKRTVDRLRKEKEKQVRITGGSGSIVCTFFYSLNVNVILNSTAN
jgi:hypothetical protein